MKYKVIYPAKLFDRVFNKVIGYCGHCRNPIFNPNAKWSKQGLCVYCWEMRLKELRGKSSSYKKGKGAIKRLRERN